MPSFAGTLREQRWDDHRFYHHSRINQSLHFISAISFVVAYVFLLINPAISSLIGWLIGMTTRQSGHFFFEPKGFDDANNVTHEYKEEVKVGYNLFRKYVLMGLWLVSPAIFLVSPTLFDLLLPANDTWSFMLNIGWMWLGFALTGVLFRMAQLIAQQGLMPAVAWVVKILTDPFHDIKLYYKAPLALARGELIDPSIANHRAR